MASVIQSPLVCWWWGCYYWYIRCIRFWRFNDDTP